MSKLRTEFNDKSKAATHLKFCINTAPLDWFEIMSSVLFFGLWNENYYCICKLEKRDGYASDLIESYIKCIW